MGRFTRLGLLLLLGACTAGKVVGGADAPDESVPTGGAGGGVFLVGGTAGRGSFVGGTSGQAFGPPLRTAVPPPPISGGTLRVQADGVTAVAADPERDSVYVVDLVHQVLRATITLQPGDEPGRHVEDAAGRVHVALRRGGALVTIDPRAGKVLGRRAICPAPRGLDFDARRGLLHVACAGGELVSLPPDPAAPVARTTQLDRDLRDVVVQGDLLFVSRFRAAEVLVVDDAGQVRGRLQPPVANSRSGSRAPAIDRGAAGASGAGLPGPTSPAVAWRMVPDGHGGVLMLHQRGVDDEVAPQPGGYGGGPCGGIVETTVTPLAPGANAPVSPAWANVTLAVDLAVSRDGRTMALVAPGNARRGAPQVVLSAVAPSGAGGAGGAQGGGCVFPQPPPIIPPGDGVPPDDELPPPSEYRQPASEAVAVAMDRKGNVIVQSRQPATLEIVTQRGAVIPLSLESRADTGHDIFHGNPQGAIVCASCHPEGGDDGRVWHFAKIGARRTQSLRGGISETAPFHWDGDMNDMRKLMQEVFVGRMSGPALSDAHVDALQRWLDTVPLLPTAAPHDPAAVARGGALFESPAVGCATCHAGPHLTNNTSVDVGTHGTFQVPSLRGVTWRAPFMHDGCAATLAARFTACGGDERHGMVSRLRPADIADLVAYLESL